MNDWNIPEPAWTRPIGDYPLGATGHNAPMAEDGAIICRTKRGIPLGGIGTGSFMLNLAGSFGPWQFSFGDNSPGSRWGSEEARGHEERYLKAAGFHVFQRGKKSGDKKIQTLATEDLFPSWPLLKKGTGTYHALFPKGWFDYDGLPVKTTMKYFSPFVPRNYELSSLPSALFKFKVENTSDEQFEVSLMFTFPNAIYREDTSGYKYTRKGLKIIQEKEGGFHGIRFQSDHPDNVPATQMTEWVISTTTKEGNTVSHAEWSTRGDGTAIMEAFSIDGCLPNKPVEDGTNGEAGAIAVQLTLEPGESEEIVFCLAWDFPIVQFKNPERGTKWWKRYKEWYPGYFKGWDIAKYVLENAATIEEKIDDWWLKIVEEPSYPGWLKNAALNELYYDLFGGVFWENGCISKPKKFGNRDEQHLYFSLECTVYRDCETLDVRHYSARHMLELFPLIERDILLAWADFTMDDPLGRVTHDAGSPMNDPFFVYGQYHHTAPNQDPPRINWKDLPSMFIQEAFAYWNYTKDEYFLEEVYPAVQKAINSLIQSDKDGDGLPENEGADTTYDCVGMYGASTFISGLYICALEATSEMGKALGKMDDHEKYQGLAGKARNALETTLWLPEGHYMLDTKSPFSRGIMTDALNGQRYAEVHGLPDVFDRERMASHLNKVYEYNFLGCEDGKYGAYNMVGEHGDELPNHYAFGIWPGGTWYTSAIMYKTGKVLNQNNLMEKAIAMAKAVHDMIYINESGAFWFNTPAIWYPEEPLEFRAQQNLRPRSVWELLLEIKDPFPPKKD